MGGGGGGGGCSELAACVADQVQPGAHVVALLCMRRGFVQALVERGCRVVAIEDATNESDSAGTTYDRLIGGHERELQERQFDALVVDLAYATHPGRALTILQPRLGESGAVVAVAPNATFADSALALLAGDDPRCQAATTEVQPRRYTRESLEQLFDESELVFEAFIRYTGQGVGATSGEPVAPSVGPELARALRDAPEARTREFVLRAHALRTPGLRWVQARMRELIEANATATHELNDLAASLHAMRELVRTSTERDAEHREVLVDAHQQLLERDTEIIALQALVQERTAWATDLDRELTERRQLIRELQTTLDQRTAWAQRLDGELAERTEWAQRLERECAERTTWAHSLDSERADLQALVAELQSTVVERTAWAQQLQRSLDTQAALRRRVQSSAGLWHRARALSAWLRHAKHP